MRTPLVGVFLLLIITAMPKAKLGDVIIFDYKEGKTTTKIQGLVQGAQESKDGWLFYVTVYIPQFQGEGKDKTLNMVPAYLAVKEENVVISLDQ